MQTISFFRLLHASLFISMLPALASTHVTNKLQGMAVYKTKEDAQEAWRKINTDSGLVDELEKTSSLNKDLIRIVLQMALPAFRMPTFYSGGKNGWIAQNNLRKLLNTVNLSNKDDVAWAYIDQLGFEDKTPILKLRFVGNDLKGVFCNFTDEYLLLLKKKVGFRASSYYCCTNKKRSLRLYFFKISQTLSSLGSISLVKKNDIVRLY